MFLLLVYNLRRVLSPRTWKQIKSKYFFYPCHSFLIKQVNISLLFYQQWIFVLTSNWGLNSSVDWYIWSWTKMNVTKNYQNGSRFFLPQQFATHRPNVVTQKVNESNFSEIFLFNSGFKFKSSKMQTSIFWVEFPAAINLTQTSIFDPTSFSAGNKCLIFFFTLKVDTNTFYCTSPISLHNKLQNATRVLV